VSEGLWDTNMPSAGEDTKSLKEVWRKTNEQQLFNELETESVFANTKLIHRANPKLIKAMLLSETGFNE